MCQIRKLRWTDCCHEVTTEHLCSAKRVPRKPQRNTRKKGWWCRLFSASPPSSPRCQITTTTGTMLGICDHCKELLAINNRKALERSRNPRYTTPLPTVDESRTSAKQAATLAAKTYRWREENGRQRDSYISRQLLQDYYLLPETDFEPIARGQREFHIHREPELPIGPQLSSPPYGPLPPLPPQPPVRNKYRAASQTPPRHAGGSIDKYWDPEISPPSSPREAVGSRRSVSPVSPLTSPILLPRDHTRRQDCGTSGSHRKANPDLRSMPSAPSRMDREIQAVGMLWNVSLEDDDCWRI